MKQVPNVVDFETQEIQHRPKYPPEPVGVSVQEPGRKPVYYAWGHPSKNNCTKSKATAVLRDLWKESRRDGGRPLLFHNGKFDLDVAEVHHGLKLPPWSSFHDTLFTLFLHDPHSRSLGLKDAAHNVLGMPPEEQQRVRQWLIEHRGVRKNDKKWGRFIALAPGDLVGEYAKGDVIRTLKLHDKLYKEVTKDSGMARSYDRERRLLPILLGNERVGLRVDVKGLERDIKKFRAAQRKVDDWLRKHLKAPRLNVGSNEELADALTKAGVVTKWRKTAPTERFPDGQRSTSKKNMTVELFNDVQRKKRPHPLTGQDLPFSPTHSAISYRNRLDTALGTFMENWLDQATANKGYICTTWNQVRQAHDDNSLGGARTSRLSSYPPFLNLPKDWYDKNDGYLHPSHIDVPELPLCRKYILPDEGEELIHVDYSQQEYRLIAHFEDGAMCHAYNENPYMDFHETMGDWILEYSGKKLERRVIKISNFLDAYGGGVGKLAMTVGCSVDEAKQIKAAKKQAAPDIANFSREVSYRAKCGESVRTWGGSLIKCPPPKLLETGHTQTFEYVLLNHLIQRSAAEMTKESIIAYHEHPKRKGRWMVAVHDENNASAPEAKREAKVLVECMEGQRADVPMLTGDYDKKKRVHYPAEYGKNWADLKKLSAKDIGWQSENRK